MAYAWQTTMTCQRGVRGIYVANSSFLILKTLPVECRKNSCLNLRSKQYSEKQSWWHIQMETFCALLAFSAGNSLVTSESPTRRPVTRSFDISFYLYLDKWLSIQWWGWWFETPSRPLWRHCNVFHIDPQSQMLTPRVYTAISSWPTNKR